MKTRFIFINFMFLTALSFLTNGKLYSQSDSVSQIIWPAPHWMTCNDISDLMSRHPECYINFSLCDECLGLQGNIAFDSTQSTTDNVTTECSEFFRQVSNCLRGTIKSEMSVLDSIITNLGKKDALTNEEINSSNEFKKKELIRIQNLMELQAWVNNYLLQLNNHIVNTWKKPKDVMKYIPKN